MLRACHNTMQLGVMSVCAVIRSDGVFHIILDQSPFLKGNLLEDLTPPIIPSEEIDDPTDKMPPDWDEREK